MALLIPGVGIVDSDGALLIPGAGIVEQAATASNVEVNVFVGPQVVAYRRGTRISPVNLDTRVYMPVVTGVADAAASNAQVDAAGYPQKTAAGSATATQASVEAAGIRQIGGAAVAEASGVSVDAAGLGGLPYSGLVTYFSNPQVVAYNRGTRIAPVLYDDWFYPSTAFGTAAVAAGQATVAGSGGTASFGTVAASATRAEVRALDANYVLPVRTSSPTPVFLNRREGYRRLVVLDTSIYFPDPDTLPLKRGRAAALTTNAAVDALGERTITGAGECTASRVFLEIVAPLVVTSTGGVHADPATAELSGTITRNGVVDASADNASVAWSVEFSRIGTVSADASNASTRYSWGHIEGEVVGLLDAQAGSASVNALASRGFVATGDAAASACVVDITARLVQPVLPSFRSVVGLVSRYNRRVALDLHVLLEEGSEPITWAVIAGALPTGLSLDPLTGVVSGTPTSIGAFVDIQVQATNVRGNAVTNLFTWQIARSIPREGALYNHNVVEVVGL